MVSIASETLVGMAPRDEPVTQIGTGRSRDGEVNTLVTRKARSGNEACWIGTLRLKTLERQRNLALYDERGYQDVIEELVPVGEDG